MPLRYTIILLFLSGPLFAQVKWSFYGDLSLQLSKAGEESHFFFNEVHRSDTDWRLDIPQINLVSKLEFSPRWSLQGRLLTTRTSGRRPGLFKDIDSYKVKIPQLLLAWTNKEQDWTIKLGRVINPFGRFNQKQLPTNQNFIGRPLAYSYSINIAEQLGFVADLGQSQIVTINDRPLWGNSHLYQGGYSTGVKFNRVFKENKLHLTMAVTNGAPFTNPYKEFSQPLRYGLIGRLGWRPKYFWEQGFSVSHGSILRQSSFNESVNELASYTQTLIGTDYLFGFQYFEISGELMYARYQVPHLSGTDSLSISGDLSLHSWSSYLDIKYEMPFLTGSYLASRIDFLAFGNFEDSNNQSQTWDQNTLRLSLAFGYKITPNLLLRTSYSWQHSQGQEFDSGDRSVFSLMLTAHL